MVAYDPEAEATTRVVLGDILQYAPSMYSALHSADALVICTEWRQFAEADLHQVRNSLRTPLILDGRNLFDPQHMAALGFIYRCVGRPFVAPNDNCILMERELPMHMNRVAASALN